MYIPDITERFPEGFGGIDLTDSFFPSGRGSIDYSLLENDLDDGMEIPFETEYKNNCKIEVGKTYSYQSLYGGMVNERCISRDGNKATFIESDAESMMDDVVKEPQVFEIQTDSDGNEYCEVYYDKHYDFHARFRANMPDGWNLLKKK